MVSEARFSNPSRRESILNVLDSRLLKVTTDIIIHGEKDKYFSRKYLSEIG